MNIYQKYQPSITRALLGNITRNMRAILFGVSDNKIYLKLITINDPMEDDIENFSVIGTEVSADFPNEDVIEEVEKNDAYPRDLPSDKYPHCVFLIDDDNFAKGV